MAGERERIGFIGLGTMGAPMARNLLRAGFELTVGNRSRANAEALAGEGATVRETPRQVAESSDVVITMVPDTPDLELVLAGEGGVFEGIREGGLVIDMSTVRPDATRELAAAARERGAGFLDAPVSGGDVGAIDGTLSVMVGGEAADVERAMPVFEAVSSTVTHIGPAGSGQVAKACNQIAVALSIAAISEALVLAEAAGVDPEKVRRALAGGMAGSAVIDKKAQIVSREFEPGFRVELHHKDLGIALAAARESGAVLPLTPLVDQMFEALIRRGRGGADHTVLLELLEELRGDERGGSPRG